MNRLLHTFRNNVCIYCDTPGRPGDNDCECAVRLRRKVDRLLTKIAVLESDAGWEADARVALEERERDRANDW